MNTKHQQHTGPVYGRVRISGYASLFGNQAMKKLTPELEYKNEKLILLIPQIASIPSTLLKNPIGTIEHLRDEIINALDFAISGI